MSLHRLIGAVIKMVETMSGQCRIGIHLGTIPIILGMTHGVMIPGTIHLGTMPGTILGIMTRGIFQAIVTVTTDHIGVVVTAAVLPCMPVMAIQEPSAVMTVIEVDSPESGVLPLLSLVARQEQPFEIPELQVIRFRVTAIWEISDLRPLPLRRIVALIRPTRQVVQTAALAIRREVAALVVHVAAALEEDRAAVLLEAVREWEDVGKLNV